MGKSLKPCIGAIAFIFAAEIATNVTRSIGTMLPAIWSQLYINQINVGAGVNVSMLVLGIIYAVFGVAFSVFYWVTAAKVIKFLKERSQHHSQADNMLRKVLILLSRSVKTR